MAGYRSSNLIIMMILETILRAMNDRTNDYHGAVKSHIGKACGLKSKTADKYLDKMEQAGYVRLDIVDWGERQVSIYRVTEIGYERYEWFVKINAELG